MRTIIIEIFEQTHVTDYAKASVNSVSMSLTDEAKNLEAMRKGQLYYAFTPSLNAARDRCRHACNRFNNAGEVSRRRLVELWREYVPQ